jgi:hypothetical protein
MIARETQEYAWGLGNGAGEVSRCFGCGSAARYFGISVREERNTGAKRLVFSLSPKHRNTEIPGVNEFLSGDPRGRQTTLQNALAKKIIIIKDIYIEPVSSLFVKTLEKLGVSSSVFRLLPLLSIQNPKSKIINSSSDLFISALSSQVSGLRSQLSFLLPRRWRQVGGPQRVSPTSSTDNRQLTTDN